MSTITTIEGVLLFVLIVVAVYFLVKCYKDPVGCIGDAVKNAGKAASAVLNATGNVVASGFKGLGKSMGFAEGSTGSSVMCGLGYGLGGGGVSDILHGDFSFSGAKDQCGTKGPADNQKWSTCVPDTVKALGPPMTEEKAKRYCRYNCHARRRQAGETEEEANKYCDYLLPP